MNPQGNGQPQPPLPASIRTTFMAGGGRWDVDEDVIDVVQRITDLVQSDEPVLWLHADHRRIAFSRALFVGTEGQVNWAVAWALKRIEVVDEPSAADILNRNRNT